MDEQPPAGGEDWLAEYKKVVDDEVKSLHDRYNTRALLNAWLFRSAGVLVICLGALLPLLAGFEFSRKNLTLGLIGVAIAVATGLRSFFQWDQLWALHRRTAFELNELRAAWDLAVTNTKDPAKVHELTEKLLLDARDLRRNESEGYFTTLRFPESKNP